MRILITGGAGFLGSHLCETLIHQGHTVICLDNLITGRTENIAALMGNPRFSFIHYNVCDYLHVDGHVDAVMHFASPASPQDYLEFPIATMKVGALGTHKALGLAKAKQTRFLLASTSEVYGDPLVNPQPETYWGNVNPISPRGVYDEAKRFAEALTTAYHRFHGLDTRIVRIFNTYGPRMRPKDGRVVSNFIVQALQSHPLTVYGEGNQTRSFCYVDDLVAGIVALLQAPEDELRKNQQFQDSVRFGKTQANLGSIHDPVNIGNPQEPFSSGNLKLLWNKASKKPSPIFVRFPTSGSESIIMRLVYPLNLKLIEGLALSAVEGRGQSMNWVHGSTRSQ
jgi:dTDP-glucose 4,6-dehydratase